MPGPGGSVPRGSAPRVPGPGGCLVETLPDGYCCGRYASYWNAFLFQLTVFFYNFWICYFWRICKDIIVFFLAAKAH